jgi:hypothetical protein
MPRYLYPARRRSNPTQKLCAAPVGQSYKGTDTTSALAHSISFADSCSSLRRSATINLLSGGTHKKDDGEIVTTPAAPSFRGLTALPQRGELTKPRHLHDL